PVAVAITDREGKPRGMVVGDCTFISTEQLLSSPTSGVNYDFFRSCLAWLSERPVVDIGISPRERGVYQPDMKMVSTTRMIVLPLCLMTLALGGLGAGIWIVRRK